MNKQYIVRNVGSNRGSPRIYLDIPALADAGFKVGERYDRNVDEKAGTLKLTLGDKFKVSGKGTLPIIDINSADALKVFEGIPAVKICIEAGTITITPLPSEENRVGRLKLLAKRLPNKLATAALSFGIGVLDYAAHLGLGDAGIESTLAVANEIDEGLLQHAANTNPAWHHDTMALAAPMQEVMLDHELMSKLPQVDLLVAGIPCSGASVAGKSKRGLSMMENHPEVGHLIVPFIALLARMNPSVVVLENVTQYADTASAQILRQMLRDMGYNVQETTMNATDYGSLENRNRWLMVASTVGLPMDIANIPGQAATKPLGAILDDIPLTDPSWSTMQYLKDKEVSDKAAGKGFAMQIVTKASTKVSVIGKGYQKNRSTEPKLQHHKDPSMLRLLTVNEHARLKGVPESMVWGLGKTEGHIALGQSVDVRPIRALFQRIGECLRSWDGSVGTAGVPYSLGLKTG